MNRFLVRIQNDSYTPDRLPEVRKILKSIEVNISNVRISSKAIEFDYFADKEETTLREKLEDALGKILLFKQLSPSSEGSDVSVERALELYKEERFWEAHEVLETLWRIEKDIAKKELIQSLILVCAAYVHMQKNRNTVSIGILKRAEHKMEKYVGHNDEAFGIDFRRLRDRLHDIIEEGDPKIISVQDFHV